VKREAGPPSSGIERSKKYDTYFITSSLHIIILEGSIRGREHYYDMTKHLTSISREKEKMNGRKKKIFMGLVLTTFSPPISP